MPSCVKCSYVQAKLNKGDLCKACYDLNTAQCSNDSDSNCLSDRSMVDMIKENMLQEKLWNDSIQSTLKDQVEFLKLELTWKNELINKLLINSINTNSDVNISTPPTELDNSYKMKVAGIYLHPTLI